MNSVAFASVIQDFDKPERDRIIEEIKRLLELPGDRSAGTYVADQATPSSHSNQTSKIDQHSTVIADVKNALNTESKIDLAPKTEPKAHVEASSKAVDSNVIVLAQSGRGNLSDTKLIGDKNDKPKTFAEALAREKKQVRKRKKNKVTGELYSSVGYYSGGDITFRKANPDLNERNWRILSTTALNNRIDTYDPAIYSRMKFVVDASVGSAVATHINVTVDPWSYTGKSKEVIYQQGAGDKLKFQYLTVGSNNYTISRIYRTIRTGDALAMPEIKIQNGNIVPANRVTTTFNGYFDLPEEKIEYTFMPLREAWLDLKPTDSVFFRFFPLAYEDQALNSDDPLKLSNNRSYWEESPWLRSWETGNYNEATAILYTKGVWDRSLSFGTRDSTGQHLTALRGMKFSFTPDSDTTLDYTIATPKTLWQNYSEINAVASSARLKHYFDDGLYLGGTMAAHQGYSKSTLDAKNYVGAIDTGIMPFENVKFNAEYSMSTSQIDMTDRKYQTKTAGKAFLTSLTATSDPYMMNKKDYFGIASGSKDSNFYKTKIFLGRMDQNFESTLSNYHATRKDAFWNRHLTFYPSTYRYLPGVAQLAYTSEDDLAAFAIGNGLDYGRMSYGWRGDVGLLDGDLKGVTDIRQVTSVTGKYHKKIETVAQTHWDLKVNDSLIAKTLLIVNKMPLTTAGVDPHLFDGETGEALKNVAVQGEKDPSLVTGALGARYQINSWSAINGVWEYTNDSTLATDNFPRGDLNSAYITNYRQNGRLYSKTVPFVYSGGLFDTPPYNFYNIFKTGLELVPMDKWHIYLDFTRNSNVFAGNIDDNMNHFGIESSYLITKNWGLFGRYTYSRWNDLGQLSKTIPEIDYRGYHNVYFSTHWVFAKDSWLSLEYGVGPAYNVATNVFDPRLAYYASTVLDTQHIFRLSVLKKF